MAHRKSLLLIALQTLTACTTLASGDDVLLDAESALLDAMADAGAGDADGHDGASQDIDASDDAGAQNDAALDASQSVVCPAAASRPRRVLSELEIQADTHWSCQEDYEIDGYVIVNRGTLSIDPDVRVFARSGAFLLIGRHARIDARGEATRPIVFGPAAHPAQPGAFRGLFMLGLADTALSNNSTLGLPSGDARAYFGGEDDNHDCGSLRFVRIEHAGGKADAEDFPAAALTLAGCGRKTRIESVQVHAATDGVGLIGGTAPLKRVLVSAPTADGIEWTQGYRGFIQHAIVQSFYGAGAALKGSHSLAEPSSLPSSAPVLRNLTLVGAAAQGLPRSPREPSGFEQGLVLQAGSSVQLHNALFLGFWAGLLDVVGVDTTPLFKDRTRVASTIFADAFTRTRPALPGGGVEPGDAEDDDGNFSEDAEMRKSSLNNRFPGSLLTLRSPFARAPLRPDFSAESFVDGGNLADTAPAGWQDLWEPAFYAGALPKLVNASDRQGDWTSADGASWTAFPEE